MLVDGIAHRTIRLAADGESVDIIDQTLLPFSFRTVRLTTLDNAERAISTMQVRGAPLVGVTAAYGVCLALRASPTDEMLESACTRLRATRPTAVNLGWALDRMRSALASSSGAERARASYAEAAKIADEDVAACEAIGRHGVALISRVHETKRGTVNVLTHCNAGWLAAVDWGTALAPVYRAHDSGIPVHVWVDETRPRNQGASLTAWELARHGVPHTVIADNASGHVMQRGLVDLCLVGSDRTTATGDVCNKIGTYLKALAARENGIPFYVALPSSSIDWTLSDGVTEIPIEERNGIEVTHVTGLGEDGIVRRVRLVPDGSPVRNPAFDVTPAKLVTALVTERGVCAATREGLAALFPESSPSHR